jgi:drug/metabolite transporter (DMT)-like permease
MIYLFIGMVFYAAALLFGTAASRNTNTNLAAGLANFVGMIIPLAVAIPFITKKTFATQKFGIIMALLSGVCIAIFAMALAKGFTLNKVGIITPVVFGGAIFLSTVVGSIIFKERVTSIEAIGLIFLAAGFGIIIYARAVVK